MTEGFQGVLIGGAIVIFGSLVVETLRAFFQKKENSRKYRIEIYIKRKEALLCILEHFRKLYVDVLESKTNPGKKTDIPAQWDYLTGFAPHLAVLPDPLPGIIRKIAADLYKWLVDNKGTGFSIDLATDINSVSKQVISRIVKVTDLIEGMIAALEKAIMEKLPKKDTKIFKEVIKRFQDAYQNQPQDVGNDGDGA